MSEAMRVALTFDAEHPDRPRCSPGVSEGIVQLLREMDVRATFFLQGRWVQARPATARRIVEEGHLVGNHSFYHARFAWLTDEGIVDDLRSAEQVIDSLAGSDPRPWLRLPFGQGWDDPRVQRCIEDLGYQHVGWDVLALDWEPDRSPHSIAEAVLKGVRAADLDGRGGEAIVLLHGWPDQTLAALPRMIDRLRDMGAEFVTVDELARITASAAL